MDWSGPQDPGTTVSEYNTRDFQIQQALGSVRTAQLVQVVTAPYSASGGAIPPGTAGPIGYIDVQPLVQQQTGGGTLQPHGVVYRIPYHRYQGGNGAFISDPVIGDIGKLVVCDRDSSIVKATGATGGPGSGRKFDLADGVYVPQCIAGAPTQFFAWLAQGFNMMDAFGNQIQGTANGVIVNGATITLAGVVISKAGSNSDTHTHMNSGGAGEGGPPTLPS